MKRSAYMTLLSYVVPLMVPKSPTLSPFSMRPGGCVGRGGKVNWRSRFTGVHTPGTHTPGTHTPGTHTPLPSFLRIASIQTLLPSPFFPPRAHS